MNTQIAEYSKTAAALADLTEIYKGVVYQVTTTEGMKDAKAGRAELRTYRTDLEKMRVSIKAPALERCRLIDAEAKEITAKLSALEDPIDAQIKAEENKEKEAAIAKAIAERQAIEAAEAKAKFERDEAERIEREAEQAKMAAQRAEIAEAQRKMDEQAKASRDAIEAAERASRLKIEEEQRQARAEREAAELVAKQAREAEEAKLKAERDRIEQERMAAEQAARKLREEQELAARIEREKKEDIQREAQRLENAKLDARGTLETFVKNYGELAEFSDVCKAINKYFSTLKKAA